MLDLESAISELVLANRILANEGVLDAFGHVSVRHLGEDARFLLSRSQSLGMVSESDIMVFDLEGALAGRVVPMWDSRDGFGDTSLLVTDMAMASSLAESLERRPRGAGLGLLGVAPADRP